MKLLPRSLKGLLLLHQTTLILLLTATALLGGLWTSFWSQSSQQSLRLSDLSYQAQQIRGDLYAQIKQVNRARLLEDPNALSDYHDYSASIDAHFAALDAAAVDPQERLVSDYLRRTYQTVRDDMDNISSDPYRPSDRGRMKILDPNYEAWMLAEFESALTILEQVIAERRRRLDASVRYWGHVAVWTLPIAVALAVALLIGSWRSLRRGFVVPMERLTAGARRLSQGELDHRIDIRGVAEARRLASALNDMAGELSVSRAALLASERQAALGALVPVVAHNIRNPLASIRATAQLIDADEPADLDDARVAIIDTVDRLARWVAALLSYLHPLKPQPRAVSLSSLVDGALAPLLKRLQDKRIVVDKRGWHRPLWVSADIDLLEQALYGLLHNALEAAPPGSRLELSIDGDPDGARLSIRDHGPGIPFIPQAAAAAEHLAPGPSTKPYGTGLGIPFAYKVCQAHQAELSFLRPADGGTEVVLLLPAVSVPEPEL